MPQNKTNPFNKNNGKGNPLNSKDKTSATLSYIYILIAVAIGL